MHIPVLLKEVIDCLDPQPNDNFVDCTLGFAGHSKAILEKTAPNGKILGIEADNEVCEQLKVKSSKRKVESKRLIVVNDSYANFKEIVARENFKNIKGVLFDLGMSSWDLENSGRGFSFRRDEPLDMRYASRGLTAEEIINKWSEEEIERILKEYGQERFAENIAKKIIDTRCQQPIKTTFQLADIIRQAIPRRFQNQRIHPATRTFQALRIEVNDELDNLDKALPQALEVVNKGGKIAVISFHSMEDRLVKNFFKNNKDLIREKLIKPSWEEIKQNPRARSAKLRVASKLLSCSELSS